MRAGRCRQATVLAWSWRRTIRTSTSRFRRGPRTATSPSARSSWMSPSRALQPSLCSQLCRAGRRSATTVSSGCCG
eukprot:7921420-Alexandrium_andersonii.AAC.1